MIHEESSNSILNDPLWGLEFLRPKPCPHPLIRLGGSADGAYLVPLDLEGITDCFSPGVSNAKSFEDELVATFGIRTFLCDYSSNIEEFATPLIPGLQFFDKKWLEVDGSPNSVSLDSWTRERSSSDDSDLLLQMDIEGAEYRNILGTTDETIRRFRIMVIEFHGLSVQLDDAQRYAQELGATLHKLSSTHTVVHAHANNCCGISFPFGGQISVPEVLEITLLRRDRFFGPKAVRASLPHPADISRNVPFLPPVVLSPWWSGGLVSAASELKALRDSEDYYRTANERLSKQAQEHPVIAAHRWLMDRRVTDTEGKNHSNQRSSTDLSRGKPFTLSSAHEADFGLHVIERREPYFFHTGAHTGVAGDFPSITIDLQASAIVSEIAVINRSETCWERANLLMYCVHESPGCDFGRVGCFPVPEGFLTGTDLSCTTSVPSLQGQFVTLFLPTQEPLHLSGVSIRGFEVL